MEYINKIIHGDCLEKLKELPDNSIDSIVTDPPAGISFMGRGWDTDKGGRDHWIAWMQEVATECKRVLKPGGHAFVWAIPRTSHWTATAWENAGFEIRDVVAHIFGSGFPKSLNIGKAVDKLQGNEREDLGEHPTINGTGKKWRKNGSEIEYVENSPHLTKGTSEWEGWGTALKPAREDWLLMRKPLAEKTVAENCLKWGTGGINIDESRVEANDGENRSRDNSKCKGGDSFFDGKKRVNQVIPEGLGRFPANLLHDNSEEVRECFPETTVGARKAGQLRHTKEGDLNFTGNTYTLNDYPANSGNASRFFKSIIYQAKSSKSERTNGGAITNSHPTIKPIALMEYLIKMVTPKGGTVLDPFAGSGSTLVAAKQNGFQYIGIEMTEEYIPIINARLGL